MSDYNITDFNGSTIDYNSTINGDFDFDFDLDFDFNDAFSGISSTWPDTSTILMNMTQSLLKNLT
jgi:hypothetical protein